ncbi:MAG TPA: Rrf2 family transcriptional regulator [Kiritimatiellia bacterium]|nr:Rrf2 family transcriptional regulator [Kiritimatiellia bacterium]HPS08657.1 Rrf2 family transcriptional regulator [Kiritimatiellia bacterium]
MKVTTRGRYGLRLLLEVALHQHIRPVTLADVALRQGISQPYLWHVVNPLKAAGILLAKRGAHGGYVLGRNPSDITIREILDVLEGDVSFVASQQIQDEVQNRVFRTAHQAWIELEKQIAEILCGVTLEDLLMRYREGEDTDSLTYSI